MPIVLWEITDGCESALDIYEGYPNLYIKDIVKVKMKDKYKTAMVYIMSSEYTNMVAVPTEYYFNIIANGYNGNNIDLNPLKAAYKESLNELI